MSDTRLNATRPRGSALVPHLIIGLAVGAGFYGMFMLACGFFVKASNIVRIG